MKHAAPKHDFSPLSLFLPPHPCSIVGGGTGVSTSLASGMPLQAYVSEGSSALYAFTVQYPSNVSIVVTSLSGDPGECPSRIWAHLYR